MARLPDGSDQALVELKAVDGAYPLYGALVTAPALPTAELFAEHGGVFGAAAPDILFERLGLKVGDRIKVGSATFELRALLDKEPDAASDGFGFAPRLLVSLERLAGDRADPAGQPVQRRLQGPARRAGGDDAAHRASATAPPPNSRKPAGASGRGPTRRRRCPPTSSASRSS